jgi:hypothetical protein
MSKNDIIDRVWDIIEEFGVCMLTTQFAGRLRARPLEARPDRNAGLIFFVTPRRMTSRPPPMSALSLSTRGQSLPVDHGPRLLDARC